MTRLMQALDGWKTIIGAVAIGALVIARGRGLLSASEADTLLGLAIAWTGISVRQAIGKGATGPTDPPPRPPAN